MRYSLTRIIYELKRCFGNHYIYQILSRSCRFRCAWSNTRERNHIPRPTQRSDFMNTIFTNFMTVSIFTHYTYFRCGWFWQIFQVLDMKFETRFSQDFTNNVFSAPQSGATSIGDEDISMKNVKNLPETWRWKTTQERCLNVLNRSRLMSLLLKIQPTMLKDMTNEKWLLDA